MHERLPINKADTGEIEYYNTGHTVTDVEDQISISYNLYNTIYQKLKLELGYENSTAEKMLADPNVFKNRLFDSVKTEMELEAEAGFPRFRGFIAEFEALNLLKGDETLKIAILGFYDLMRITAAMEINYGDFLDRLTLKPELKKMLVGLESF